MRILDVNVNYYNLINTIDLIFFIVKGIFWFFVISAGITVLSCDFIITCADYLDEKSFGNRGNHL